MWRCLIISYLPSAPLIVLSIFQTLRCTSYSQRIFICEPWKAQRRICHLSQELLFDLFFLHHFLQHAYHFWTTLYYRLFVNIILEEQGSATFTLPFGSVILSAVFPSQLVFSVINLPAEQLADKYSSGIAARFKPFSCLFKFLAYNEKLGGTQIRKTLSALTMPLQYSLFAHSI